MCVFLCVCVFVFVGVSVFGLLITQDDQDALVHYPMHQLDLNQQKWSQPRSPEMLDLANYKLIF